MANNLLIQNARLKLVYAKTLQKGAINLDPVEFTYQWGQINSSNPDYYLEVNQNFGSIVTIAQTLRQARMNYEWELTAYELTIKQLSAEIKSAYLFWQYQYAIVKVREEETTFYQRLAEVVNLRYETGDISLLERTLATSKASEVNSNYLNSLDDLVIADLKFHQLLSANTKLIPFSESFQIYEIVKTGDTSSLRGETMTSYFDTKYKLVKSEEAIIRLHYFPEITAGFFSQEIENEGGLYGWQIGLALPIWIRSQHAEVVQSRIESQIAMNELEYNKNRIASEIESLLYDLNKSFRQIRHYQLEALPQADILIKTAEDQLQAEEIDYTKFLESISKAIQIKEGYFSVVNDYNQKAVQLEMYEK